MLIGVPQYWGDRTEDRIIARLKDIKTCFIKIIIIFYSETCVSVFKTDILFSNGI